MAHGSCPKCGATIEGETKSCSACGSVSISCISWTLDLGGCMGTLGDRMMPVGV
ncbi:hypothetical protein BJ508DRAFT_417884 [Ascobolus immersus RN42]|uniref:Zinc-ribbon domain-containing protein n=1 Tax=Ascobolus immersus RN42 TaxID=1160509 RepID=A0A3N4HPY1_ASCIM|nr:hypothetical protein BJ508DRAFT_417884 [Ascobolus immersus RN42]